MHLQPLVLMCRDPSFVTATRDMRVTEQLALTSTNVFLRRVHLKRRVPTLLDHTLALVALVGRPIQMVRLARMLTGVRAGSRIAEISDPTVKPLMGRFFVHVFQAIPGTVCSVPT